MPKTLREGYLEYTDANIQVEIGKALAVGKMFQDLSIASRLDNPLEKMLEEEDKGKPFQVKIGSIHNVKVVLLNTIPEGEVHLLWKEELLCKFDTKE
jgi:hypothetical protein